MLLSTIISYVLTAGWVITLSQLVTPRRKTPPASRRKIALMLVLYPWGAVWGLLWLLRRLGIITSANNQSPRNQTRLARKAAKHERHRQKMVQYAIDHNKPIPKNLQDPDPGFQINVNSPASDASNEPPADWAPPQAP
jgi:hypothetical protein